MKKLIFVRHAKSSWKHGVSDIYRPLKKKGVIDSALVSEEFLNYGFTPEIVFSSSAKRALETCEMFIKNLKMDKDIIRIEDKLYDFNGMNVISFIKSIDNNYNTVMIFGHNHALTSIVNTYGTTYIENLPTSGLVAIKLNIDNWIDLRRGETLLTIFPRDLKD